MIVVGVIKTTSGLQLELSTATTRAPTTTTQAPTTTTPTTTTPPIVPLARSTTSRIVFHGQTAPLVNESFETALIPLTASARNALVEPFLPRTIHSSAQRQVAILVGRIDSPRQLVAVCHRYPSIGSFHVRFYKVKAQTQTSNKCFAKRHVHDAKPCTNIASTTSIDTEASGVYF